MKRGEHRTHELLAQTARITWLELEKHFARGVVLRVAADRDLVEVATALANDDKGAVERWLEAQQLMHLDSDTARRWSAGRVELWAVVVAPWVVVQERPSNRA
jgi:hypothetical protein